jgi:PiT family inorganic phosphate transporter
LAVDGLGLISLGLITFFAFWNGFTDAANAIATIVGTRVLRPFQAVAMSAAGNFVGLFFGSAVASTIAGGIVPDTMMSAGFIIAVLLGGLTYDVITYYYGIPCSETHVLIGGLVGAGIAAAGPSVVKFDSVVDKVVIPMITSPVIAFFATMMFTVIVIRLFWRKSASQANKTFSTLQILSSFFFSFSHGSNDGQKTVGLMTGMLIFYGIISKGPAGQLVVPYWVILLVQCSLSIGTLLGGWRIVKTMGLKITRLRPYQGFCAESAASMVLAGTAALGFPVSTTHAISGAILGVGATRRLSAVKWGVARRIVVAWILTIPMAAIFAYIIYSIFAMFL